MATKQDSHVSRLYLFFFAVIIYNFNRGHNTSLPRCAPLLLSIILFSVMSSSVLNGEKIKYKYKYKNT